jgi:aminoglycoside/choline kinase family phosphotransferase
MPASMFRRLCNIACSTAIAPFAGGAALTKTVSALPFAILAAQRATKILGIFVRLDERDGKPGYLAHIPRLQAYLRESLAHPALADLASWYENTVFSMRKWSRARWCNR